MSGINSNMADNRTRNDHSTTVEKAERRVNWVYNWLALSVFLTVPWMLVDIFLVGMASRSSTGDWVLAALAPASLHLVLLKDRKSPYAFVRAHARQALLLAGVRTFSAVYFIGLLQGEGAGFWFVVNGFLWLFGSFWGWRQVSRGDCWLVRQHIWFPGKQLQLPRPWTMPAPVQEADKRSVTKPAPKPSPAAERPVTSKRRVKARRSVKHPALGSSWTQDQGQILLSQGRVDEARSHYLALFRRGPGPLRKKAIEQLEEMGEVELF